MSDDHEPDNQQPTDAPGPAADPAAGVPPADDDSTATDLPIGDELDDEGWDDDDGAATHNPAVRYAQIGLVVLALVIVGIVFIAKSGGDDKKGSDGGTASGGTTVPADGSAAPREDWPANVGGRPPALGERGQPATAVKVAGGTKPGVYVWNDFDGWHLWAVGGAGLPAITGSIQSNDVFAQADLAVPGQGTVTKSDKVADFTLPAGVPLSGLDFNPGFFGKQMVFTLEGPDGPIDPSLVHVGTSSEQAPFPLVIEYGPQP